MKADELSTARRFYFPTQLAEYCLEALRMQGQEGAELFIALSADRMGDREIRFRRALIPEQMCHRTPYGLLVTIDGDALFQLNRSCYEAGEVLAGQIHAHPGRAYHSGADDQLALVQLPGGLSIVVPDFAAGPLRPRRWSVFRLRGDGSWHPKPWRVKLRIA
ncbi:MAG: hypothetical protein ACJ76B_05160 [Solirubrobacterales bacterium]